MAETKARRAKPAKKSSPSRAGRKTRPRTKELTTELKRAREGLADGDGKQGSPIEVLLRGLTARG